MKYCQFTSAFGITLAAAEDGRLCHLWFPNQKHEPATDNWERDDSLPLFQEVQKQLQEYAEGIRQEFTIPLAPKGTDFQQQVWRELLAIPFGDNSSYGALALQLGKPKAARAVGGAVGRNPIAIMIPCHRVQGSNGSLTGFASGLEMKQRLLTTESA